MCTIPALPSTFNCPCEPAALADNVNSLGKRTGF
jgi:hypothetical protein